MYMKNSAQGRSVCLPLLSPSPRHHFPIAPTVFSIVRARRTLTVAWLPQVNILIFLLYKENMFTVETPEYRLLKKK